MGGRASLTDLVELVVKEGRRRILAVAAIFSAIVLATLAIAMLRQKVYEASALILVEPKSVISPTISTVSGAESGLMKQIMRGRPILREILAAGGWAQKKLSPRDEDQLLRRLSSNIRIDTPRPELVRISFSDSDPQRAFEITNKITAIYIREATVPQEREARAAFEFIDKQAKEYSAKLAEAHEAVLAHLNQQEASKPAAPGAAPERRPAEISPAKLAALRVEEATLLSEVGRTAHKDENTEADQIDARYRERVQQLQTELDRLLSTYTEAHPDVVRARRELAKVQQAAAQAKAAREAADNSTAKLDDQMARAARARLAEVQRQIALATGTQQPLAPPVYQVPGQPPVAAIDPEMRLVTRDATTSELLRRYEATRDIYQDLLRRRENARVSLELSDQHGINLKVQEPAELPVTPVSARLLYVIAIGWLLALAAPIGLLFALVRLDPRVRSAKQIQALEVPFLVTVPYVAPAPERSRQRTGRLLAGLMVGSALAVYLVTFYLRYKSSS